MSSQPKVSPTDPNMSDSKGINMEDRDPNDINDHLRVEFEDVLAEPAGAHSNDCVWRCSFCCFNCGKLCCYRFLTILCGWLHACCWGFEFACITFVHIWQFTPALRMLAINCGCLQKFWGTTLQCFLAPICETMGLCLSRMGININKTTTSV